MENTWRFRVDVGVSLAGHMAYLIPDFCMFVLCMYALTFTSLQFEAYWFYWVGQPMSFRDLLILNNPSAGVGSDSSLGSWGSKLRPWCVQSSLYWCGGPFIYWGVSPTAKVSFLWSPHSICCWFLIKENCVLWTFTIQYVGKSFGFAVWKHLKKFKNPKPSNLIKSRYSGQKSATLGTFNIAIGNCILLRVWRTLAVLGKD